MGASYWRTRNFGSKPRGYRPGSGRGQLCRAATGGAASTLPPGMPGRGSPVPGAARGGHGITASARVLLEEAPDLDLGVFVAEAVAFLD